ncbi:MAG TPA: hypothetical protein VJ955_02945 [Desulfuromonadales bacterium]|nr:hypothetical protein [Desulfuromonadales bacterium]
MSALSEKDSRVGQRAAAAALGLQEPVDAVGAPGGGQGAGEPPSESV